MAARVAVVAFLCLLFAVTGCHAQDVHAMLLKVVDAIEKLVHYLKANYSDINLDGLYGLRILEGQAQMILKEHSQGQHASLSPSIVQRLQTILQDIKWTGKGALAAVQADDAEYFKNLAFIITEPWVYMKSHRHIKPTGRWEIPIYQASANFSLEEHHSDQCMMETVKSQKARTPNGAAAKCQLSKECGLRMTKRGLTEYGITHQILWTALSEKQGCRQELEALLLSLGFSSVEAMQEEFCTNNYYEMLAVIHVFMMGKVKGDYQDLFLEQQFVCPNVGFFEFLKKDYLDQILSWQQPQGCFGTGSEETDDDDQQLLKVPPQMDPAQLEVGNDQEMREKSTLDKSGLKGGRDQLAKLQEQLKEEGKALPLKFGSNRLPVNGVHNGNNIGPPLRNPPVVPLIQQMKQLNRQAEKPSQGSVARKSLVGTHQLKGPDMAHGVGYRIHKDEPNAVQGRVQHNALQGVGKAEKRLQGMNKGVRHPVNVLAGSNRLLGRKLASAFQTGQGTKRKLLVEKQMPEGCLSHKTGVACGALAMYLRYLIDPGPLDLFGPHAFFPDGARTLLGDEANFKNIVNFLNSRILKSKEQDNAGLDMFGFVGHANGRDAGLDDGEEGDEGDNKDRKEEDDYDGKDDIYPDVGGGGDGQVQNKKVVHFDANNDILYKDQKNAGYGDDDGQQDKDDYGDGNEDEDEDEEGADYIKRAKGENHVIGNDNEGDDSEHTYYDDDDNTDRGIVKKHKPHPQPQSGPRIKAHRSHKPYPPMIDASALDQSESPPAKTVILLLSCTSLLLVFFMYRFIRKRRLHLRYHTRGFFRL